MPISLYLWSIPLRTGTKSQEHHSRLPKVNWRGYCMVGQPHPQVYSPYSSNGHHPGHLLQVSVWWQGLPCLDCTQILQKKDRKMSFSHSLHFGQKTMTGAYIPCAYQQGIVHDAPLLSGNKGQIQSPPTLSSPAFRLPSLPPPTPPCILPCSHPPVLPLYHLRNE